MLTNVAVILEIISRRDHPQRHALCFTGHQAFCESFGQRNDVVKIIRQTLATGAMLLVIGVTFVSAQGRGRGGEGGPPNPPPGQERKVIAVPEPATLTLLGAGLGAGLVMRRLKSRRNRSRE
jgi:PEP-CTERM motif